MDTLLRMALCLMLGLALSAANVWYVLAVSRAVHATDPMIGPLSVLGVPGSLAGPGAGATPGA